MERHHFAQVISMHSAKELMRSKHQPILPDESKELKIRSTFKLCYFKFYLNQIISHVQTMCILNTDGCNVLETLPEGEYMRCLDLLRDIILGT